MAQPGAIKVTLEGRGSVTLRQADYVTSGGEGSIYRTGDTIVKLYADFKKMQRDGMPEKVRALSALNHPGIVAPQGVVLDEQKSPAGFYMPFVSGEPMSRVFVSDFRMRTGFGDADAVKLAHAMYDVVAHAHSRKAIMVDANELNWLVEYVKGKKVAASVIDVDSWAIGRWPATVIMPSIRDWNAKSFDEKTDWFAWGIVAFQVFTGIHPFKGKLDGYKPGELVRRMKENASVFSPGVKLPAAVRDFSCVPGPLMDWFQATFQQGLRSIPPSPTAVGQPARAARVMRAVTGGPSNATFEKLFDRVGDPAVRVWANGVVRLASGEMAELGTGKHVNWQTDQSAEVVVTGGNYVIGEFRHGEPYFIHRIPGGAQIGETPPLRMSRIWRAGEQLFAVTGAELVEAQYRMLAKPVLTFGRRWAINANATTWFDDVAVQDVLGAAFVVLSLSAGGIVQVRAPALDGANVVAGKAGGHFAAFIILEKSGDYRRVELTFSKDYSSFTTWTGPTDSAELNMAILPRGVVATIVDDGELTIFVPANGNLNKVVDRNITTDMKLAAWGEKLVYIQDGAVWRLTT